jgi:pumilio RNA-binding family
MNNINNINNINFSELSSHASFQSLNKNKKYNNYYNNKFNYCNNHNIHIKMKDEANKSINGSWKKMLKDQKGSKLIQKKIEEKSSDFLNKLYEQIKNNLQEIMTDQYGNYVIQKFVEYCDKKIISEMFSQISNSLYEISINNYGTRPVQKMIENLAANLSIQDINIILGMTKGNVLDLIKDINGNRVIQSIIQNIKNKELLSPLYKELSENITEILKTKSGCCVFSKVILNITESDLNLIVDNIIKNFSNFINDEFGNISIKRLIKLNNENYNSKIFPCIKDSIINLSCQKFSSNVIEACIDNNTSLKKMMIDKLIEDESIIIKLILDQFGNYIVQKALQNSEQKEFDIIIGIIKNNEKKLKQSQYGKVVYEKLMKNYKKYLIDDKSEKGNNKNKNKKHNNGNKNKNKFGGNKKNK